MRKKIINLPFISSFGKSIVHLGIAKMEPELINLVGKLKYRSSYGQNALQHSIEVANLTGKSQ